MERKRTAKRDDEAQSKRFIEMAREIGADASKEEFERAFKKVVPAGKPTLKNPKAPR
jgi:hypothetical protein